MGATGRVGGALRDHKAAFIRSGLCPIWQARNERRGFLRWDILAEPCPRAAARDVVLCLADVTYGAEKGLEQSEVLALAACRAAIEQGGRHVFVASSAAVYRPPLEPLAEDALLVPPGAYGATKLRMERAARAVMPANGPGLTILRIGNIAGFDALLGRLRPREVARLDPVEGQPGGPVRSYIGPVTLAQILVRLAELAAKGVDLPPTLNIAAAPVFMEDLLDAAGADWTYGAVNPAANPRMELDITRLKGLVEIAPDAGRVAEMVGAMAGMRPSKRVLGLVLVVVLTMVLVLPFSILLLVLLLREGRPLFYLAERMKGPAQPFLLWKLRTMSVVEEDSGVLGENKAGRITPLGGFIRCARMDEVPQLWNVLKGDMSFVGPRPPLREYVERFPEIYGEVLKSPTGITGLASLRFHEREEVLLAGCRDAEETDRVYSMRCVPQKARLDLIYQRNWSLCFDLALMWETSTGFFDQALFQGRTGVRMIACDFFKLLDYNDLVLLLTKN